MTGTVFFNRLSAGYPWRVTKTLRQEHTEHTRRALMSAATTLFADKGYAATSIDDVVARARVTRGALYHHFENKLDIFKAVCEAAETHVVQRVQETAGRPGTPKQRLIAALDTYFDECQNPTYQAIVLREGHDPQIRREGTRYIPAMSEMVRGMVNQLRAEQVVQTANPEILAQLVCAVLCEAAYAVGSSPNAAETKQHAKELVHRMLFGEEISA
jgi:AcrR family transcriptional regulator